MFSRKIDEIQGIVLIEGDLIRDDRGWQEELFCSTKNYPRLQGQDRQMFISCSNQWAVHGPLYAPFSKLCSCLSGKIYDVTVDLRQSSPTYLKWFGVWLDPKKQIFVPAGCAHGYFAAENNSILLSLHDGLSGEKRINWRDPKLNITWPPAKEYLISDKDKKAEFL